MSPEATFRNSSLPVAALVKVAIFIICLTRIHIDSTLSWSDVKNLENILSKNVQI